MGGTAAPGVAPCSDQAHCAKLWTGERAGCIVYIPPLNDARRQREHKADPYWRSLFGTGSYIAPLDTLCLSLGTDVARQYMALPPSATPFCLAASASGLGTNA